MTAVPHLTFLGRFTIQLPPGSPATPALRRKTRALLVYLAATGGGHTRQQLMTLFCPAANDPARVLSLLLSRIRRNLGTAVLLTEGNTAQINPQAVWLDVHQFEKTLTGDLGEQSTEALKTAVALHRGELAEGLTLPDASQFELWLLGERARFRRLYEKGLAELVTRFITAGQFQLALEHARQQVQSNPLAEEAQARLIWLYAQTGQRDVALRQFEQCRTLLQEELAVEPMPELLALQGDILAGRVGRAAPRPLTSKAPERATERKSETTVFVGRTDQLKQLHAAWQAVQEGKPAVVLVDAPAGGGKTRLVQEFAYTHPQTRLLTGRGYESSRATPYQPWIQLLESHLAGLDETAVAALPPYQRSELARLLPVLALDHHTSPASGQQEQLFHAVAQFLLDNAPEQLIFLDDLQWADEASLSLFHFLAQRLTHRKRTAVLLLGAWRSEEAEDNPALLTLRHDLLRGGRIQQLSLPPLDNADAAALISHLWPELPPGYRTPHLRDRFLQATGGNPLFVIEMARELAGADELPAALPVPPSLQLLIQRRLRRFPMNGRQVIEALAVLDQPGHFDLIRQISGRSEDETVNALELGLRWRLVEPHSTETGLYDFSHDLVREAVAQQLNNARRHLLHRRTADALVQMGGDAAAITHHFGQAGDKKNEAIYARLAGQGAAAVYAHNEAVGYLNRALGLTTATEERLALQIQLARIYHLIGRWSEAQLINEQVLAKAQLHKLVHIEAATRAGIGQLLVSQGKHDEALPWLDKAREQQTILNERHSLVETLHHLGLAVWWRGEYQSALDYFEQQQQLAIKLKEPLQAIQALSGLGMTHNSMGNQKQALQIYGQMQALAVAENDQFSIARASSNIGLIFAQQGDFAAALSHWYQSVPIYHLMEEKEQLNRTVGNMGRVFQIFGDFSQALIYLGWQLELCVGMGAWQTASIALTNISATAYDQGDYRASQAASQRAVALGRKLNIPAYLCDYLVGLALCELELGAYQQGLQHAGEAQQIAAAVQRQDALFMAEHTLIRLRLAAQMIDGATAVSQLQEMLPHWPDENHQAELHYFIWQVDAAQDTHRQQAAALYGRMYPQSPAAVYRRRYGELTGDSLEPVTLPLPPEDIDVKQTDMATLMLAIDRFLE